MRDDGQGIELRLVRSLPRDSWLVTVFGSGSWRQDTDARPEVADLAIGERLTVSPTLAAEVVNARHARTAEVRFNLTGAAFWQAVYQSGRPIQYRHVTDELPLWEVQTPFASRPWASEMPSAGQPLTWSVLLALRRRGVVLATLTHGAGISATGSAALDASLPWQERFDLPARTIMAIADTRRAGGRVIAVGTSVVRALEGCAADNGGRLQPGEGETDYRIGPATRRRIVDGLLTGMHEPTASHYDLLQAFAPIERWRSLYARAEAAGFRSHEFGDLTLIVSPLASSTCDHPVAS
jgi:S-adenosylmethionine:tRNA ribosyltransferase-isomerase